MDIASPVFLLFLAAALVFYHGVSRLPVSWRLFLINAVFCASFFSTPLAMLPLATFAVAGVLAVHMGRRWPAAGLTPVLVVGLVALFAVIKRYSIIPEALTPTFAYTVVGLSYLLFRVLHLLVDVRQGAIREVPGPLACFNYLFCFLTFVSGPIQRYQDHRDADPSRLGRAELCAALARIVEGFVKVMVAAAVANDVAEAVPVVMATDPTGGLSIIDRLPDFLRMGSPEAPVTRLTARLLLHGAAFTLYLYVNFQGYMDIVVGAARLFGFTLPENFDRPFAARNLLDFWSRWHMTLSTWFKMYLFNPLLMALATRVGGGKAASYLAVPTFLVTFLVMGVWHGTTPAFWVYGLLLGGGVSLNKLAQLLLQEKLGKKGYKALAARPLYGALARGLMIGFFVMALGCLWLDSAQLGTLAGLFGASGLVRMLVLATLAAAVLMSLWDGLEDRLAPLGGWAWKLCRVAGFAWLWAIWGNLMGANSAVETLLGFGLPDAMKAIPGGLALLIGGQLRDRRGEPVSSTWAGFEVALLVFVGLSHAGAVPDFVYKGF